MFAVPGFFFSLFFVPAAPPFFFAPVNPVVTHPHTSQHYARGWIFDAKPDNRAAGLPFSDDFIHIKYLHTNDENRWTYSEIIKNTIICVQCLTWLWSACDVANFGFLFAGFRTDCNPVLCSVLGPSLCQ